MNAMFVFELARRMAATTITVNCVHPGGSRSHGGKWDILAGAHQGSARAGWHVR
jgi:NAD(P)-dependent dehydrogenase (short-subunit alcohol dehydrogenase family)